MPVLAESYKDIHINASRRVHAKYDIKMAPKTEKIYQTINNRPTEATRASGD